MLLAQILLNGILLGGLYGLMALGMALVWGVLNIVNLAHGAFVMLGGYCVYFAFHRRSASIRSRRCRSPFLAMFALGYLLQRYVLNLIVRSAQLNTLLITFGLDVVLTYLAQLAFTADFRTINPSYAGANVTIFGLTLPLLRFAAFVAALIFAAFALGHAPADAAGPRHSRDGAESHGGAALRRRSGAPLRADLRSRCRCSPAPRAGFTAWSRR